MSDIQKLRDLIEQVSGRSEAVAVSMDDLKERISRRELIEKPKLQELIAKTVELTSELDKLREEFSRSFPGETAPGLLPELEARLEELESLNRKLEEAKAVVGRFAAVTASADDARRLHADYLAKLSAIDADKMTLDEYKSAIQPYELFCEAVTNDDYAERIKMCDSIYGFFGGDMMTHLFLNHFSIGEAHAEAVPALAPAEPEAAEEPFEPEAPQPEKPKAPVEENRPEAANWFTVAPRKLGKEVRLVSKKRDVPVNYKEYKAELKKNYTNYVRTLSTFGASAATVNDGSDLVRDMAMMSAFESSVTGGYIDKLVVDGMPTYFNVSERGLKAMIKHNDKDTDDACVLNAYEIADPSRSGNIYLMRLGQSAVYYPMLWAYMRLMKYSSAEMGCDYFRYQGASFVLRDYMRAAGENFRRFCVSVCLADDDDAARLDSMLELNLSNVQQDFDFVFIASDTFPECEKCLEYIRTRTGKTDNAKVVFYSALKNEYSFEGLVISKMEISDMLFDAACETFGITIKQQPADDTDTTDGSVTGIAVRDYSVLGTAEMKLGEKPGITSWKFRKDVGHRDYFPVLLGYLCDNRAITVTAAGQLLRAAGISLPDGVNVCEELLNMGYLNRFSLPGYGTLYHISETLKRQMNKSNVRWLKSNYHIYCSELTFTVGEAIMPDDPEFNKLYLSALCIQRIAEFVMSIDYKVPPVVNNSLDSGISLGSIICKKQSDEVIWLRIFAPFISSETERENSRETLHSHFERIWTKCDVIFLAACTLEDCEAELAYLSMISVKVRNARHIAYVLDEDKFYSDGKEFTKDDLADMLDSLSVALGSRSDEPEAAEPAPEPEAAEPAPEPAPEPIPESAPEPEPSEPADTIPTVPSEPEVSVIPEPPAPSPISTAVDRGELLDTVCTMLMREKFACASAYLRAVSMRNLSYEHLYNALGYAIFDPAVGCLYDSNTVSAVFDEESDFPELTDVFKLCAVLRTLFVSDRHDYSCKALTASVLGVGYIEENPTVRELLSKLLSFRDNADGMGIDRFADYRSKGNANIETMLAQCSASAKVHLEQYYNNPVREISSCQRYVDTVNLILDQGEYLYYCLSCAVNDDRSSDDLSIIESYLRENFIQGDSEIRSTNINAIRIDDFIDSYWNAADKIQFHRRRTDALTGHLRNKLTKMLMKILTDIADWYYYVTMLTDNSFSNSHKSEKNEIMALIADAENVCGEIANSGDRDKCFLAVNACVRSVLSEFADRLSGSYIDNANRYYYADFLTDGEVMLDENFLPVIENELSAVKDFSPEKRICRHAEKPVRNICERIDEIFNLAGDYDDHLGDDYGCAALIREYAGTVLGLEWDDERSNIEKNAADAEKQMDYIHSSFIGTLELDQSYGKIDIDRKDRLLALVDRQYNSAMESRNFGFFRRLLDHCKQTVAANAEKRKGVISGYLQSVREEAEEEPKAAALIEKAERMMEIQNYTVVEDIINRIQQKDFTDETVIPEHDYLTDFIRSYETIFSIVNNQTSTKSLLNRIEASDKFKGQKKCAENIITNFPPNDLAKTSRLLEALGFNVESVTPLDERPYYYNITLKKPANGRRDNYLHPIFPFGSLAVENGFRVVTLFGRTSDNILLDTIKMLGSSTNTIIMVNWALELSEWRDLARKIKQQIHTDSVFLVIDRVVMYYLADKNEQSTSSINRMLMQITVPFASFQPYSVDAAKPIRCEMFMGRTKLLSDVESVNGANILCGGRQLGKSALLRMAQSEINFDGRKRAVYEEIVNCDYRQAALKVSQKLIDDGILDGGTRTDDWEELARMIRIRMNDTSKPEISYLLLLVDECDELFDSTKEMKYFPIRTLETLQIELNGRFKFVLAGLRNLVKFEKEKVRDVNSSLPHISVNTIRPFTAQEARELLELPLYHVGVRFPKDQEYLISLILASTNYFPGLIHQYCASLINAISERDYAGYTVAETPPYQLTEKQIKKILSDEKFTSEILNKFEITLNLDEDNYYWIIALIVAYCTYNEDPLEGFSVSEIMDVAVGYEITKITELGEDKLAALTEELCELNILRRNKVGKYLFARHNFIQLLGRDKDEIDNKLMDYLGGD